MFTNDDKQETVARLIRNARVYSEKRIECLERSTAEKMSTLLCAVIVGGLIIVVGGIIIVLLSIAAVIALAPHVGGTIQACLFVALAYTVVLLIIYLLRGAIFRSPISRLLTRLILEEKADAPAPTPAEMERARQAVLRDYQALTTPAAPPRTKKERFFNALKKAWNLAEGGIMGYRFYKQYKARFRR